MFNPFSSNKPNLTNYISGVVEIGYSQYGPTLALAGNMTAVHKVIFIYNISLEVRRKGSSGKFNFNWFAFRPHKFNMGGFSGIDMKMASKFTVSPSESHSYNILFSDLDRYAEMSLFLKQLKKGWEKGLESSIQAASPQSIQNLFEDFAKQNPVINATQQLHKMCYWQEGEYNVKIKINLHDLGETLDVEKYFSLTALDAENLRANAPTIVADLCKQPRIVYNYVCPNLVERL